MRFDVRTPGKPLVQIGIKTMNHFKVRVHSLLRSFFVLLQRDSSTLIDIHDDDICSNMTVAIVVELHSQISADVIA